MGSQHSSKFPLGYLVHEVARLFKRRFEEEARIHGITLPQWRALAEISMNDGMTQVELASAIDTDPMTLSGILDRLVKRGLITRYPDPNDSRAKLAAVTETGRELIDMVRRVGLGIYQQAIEGIPQTDIDLVSASLTRMRNNLMAMNAAQKEPAE